MANALANLIATLVLGAKESCTERLIGRPKDSNEEEVKLVSVYEIDEEDQCQPLINYLEHRKLRSQSRHKTEAQWGPSRFLYYKGTLYRSSFLSLWLQCPDNEERKQVMEEAHASVCGVHQLGPKLHDRVKRMVVIGPPWCVTVLTSLKDFIHVNYMLTSFTNLRSHSIQPSRPTFSSMGARCRRTVQSKVFHWAHIHFDSH